MKIIMGLALTVTCLNLYGMDKETIRGQLDGVERQLEDNADAFFDWGTARRMLNLFGSWPEERDELKKMLKKFEGLIYLKDLNHEFTIVRPDECSKALAFVYEALASPNTFEKKEEQPFSPDLTELLKKMEACTVEDEDNQEILERRFFPGVQSDIDELKRFLKETNRARTIRIFEAPQKPTISSRREGGYSLTSFSTLKETRSAKAELFLVNRVLYNRPPKENRS
jgi:hypothetical protein